MLKIGVGPRVVASFLAAAIVLVSLSGCVSMLSAVAPAGYAWRPDGKGYAPTKVVQVMQLASIEEQDFAELHTLAEQARIGFMRVIAPTTFKFDIVWGDKKAISDQTVEVNLIKRAQVEAPYGTFEDSPNDSAFKLIKAMTGYVSERNQIEPTALYIKSNNSRDIAYVRKIVSSIDIKLHLKVEAANNKVSTFGFENLDERKERVL